MGREGGGVVGSCSLCCRMKHEEEGRRREEGGKFKDKEVRMWKEEKEVEEGEEEEEEVEEVGEEEEEKGEEEGTDSISQPIMEPQRPVTTMARSRRLQGYLPNLLM